MDWYTQHKSKHEDYAPNTNKSKHEKILHELQTEHNTLVTKQTQYYASIQLRMFLLNLHETPPSYHDILSWISILKKNEST